LGSFLIRCVFARAVRIATAKMLASSLASRRQGCVDRYSGITKIDRPSTQLVVLSANFES